MTKGKSLSHTVQISDSKINQLDAAISALGSVQDLCCAVSEVDPAAGLAMVNADRFAVLLGLLVNQMRDALQPERGNT